MPTIEPTTLSLFHEPPERLRLTIGGERSYHTVKPVWASPQSHPGKYLVLLDGKGSEIGMVVDPSSLASSAREAVEIELHRRYLTATIRRVTGARQEYAATYWSVQTDRGDRDFVTQSLQENAYWFTPTHLLLLDVDGNRFEILDVGALDPLSQSLIGRVLCPCKPAHPAPEARGNKCVWGHDPSVNGRVFSQP